MEEFLDRLPPKAAQKVVWVLQVIEELDPVPAVYFSKLTGTDDIWECRVKLGSNIYRVFAFQDGPRIVLTHGLVKKTQKTPAQDIQKAENYRKAYFARQGR